MSFASRRVSVPARLVREIGGLLCTRPAKVKWPGGVVSFTFDDFPRSAWTEGGAILERLGAHGTYYAALGLAGGEDHLGPMFGLDDLRAAQARGHEIACHTFSHRDCRRASAAEIAAEVETNAAALAQALNGAAACDFAYPFGAVSQAAKSALARRFASCRGCGPGVNHGTVDLADLFGNSLYGATFDRARLLGLIDRAREIGGWTIFYTHDVRDAPSAYGCTPAQFAEIAGYAAGKAAVLPVRDVLARLGIAGAQPASPQAA
jgi:peptidoglycan/xylan/chitin deacetylase (PgdA/CDA1 family)